jgi:hypothetical protein
MREIRIGLECDVDVTQYARFGYSPDEMSARRLELIKSSAAPTADNFTPEQTQEIIRGIEAGLDVSSYSDPSLSPEQMREKREDLIREMNGGAGQ